MGRTRKTGLDYFSFDTDFFSNRKIVCVAGEFGIKGEIVAIKLLCAIYRNGYFMEWSESAKYTLLTQLPGISVSLLEQIVNRLVRWEFFDASLFDSDKVLTSASIQRRYFEAVKWRKIDGNPEYLLIGDIRNYSGQNWGKSDFPTKNADFPTKNGDFPTINPINKKRGNNNISCETTTETTSAREAKGIEAMKEELKADRIFWENAAASQHATVEALEGLLGEFVSEQIALSRNHESYEDFRRHFYSWAKIAISKQQKPKDYDTKQSDRFSERRGTEPSAKSRKGFKGTF